MSRVAYHGSKEGAKSSRPKQTWSHFDHYDHEKTDGSTEDVLEAKSGVDCGTPALLCSKRPTILGSSHE